MGPMTQVDKVWEGSWTKEKGFGASERAVGCGKVTRKCMLL